LEGASAASLRAPTAVIDRAIQVHGGAGVTDVTPLQSMYGWHRAMRLFDGPDEVHLRSIAKAELGRPPVLPPGRAVPEPRRTAQEGRS
jgi:acyl-CoA dehydrogenase